MQIRDYWTRTLTLTTFDSDSEPTQLPSLNMPSLTTTILTTAVTLTSFVTVTAGQYVDDYPAGPPPPPEYSVPSSSSSYPVSTTTEYCPECTAGEYSPPDVIGPIEGLPQCTQTIVFECLQNSACSPHDFACVCDELYKLNLEGRVNAACPGDIDQYKKFQWDICNAGKKPEPPANVTSTPAPIVVYSTGISNVTTTVPGPFSNATVVVPVTTTEQQTQTVHVATTDAAGMPTTIVATIVTPVTIPATTPATTPAAPTDYTGAGAALEVVSMKSIMVAGAMGLVGLIFAEL
ncbi:Nn.00g059640.m01.CDS01 [Neocucurbitaria sp. VM-36]